MQSHHSNAAQTLPAKPLAPSLLNYAELSLLKGSFSYLLWLLMEEGTTNVLQHTSQSAAKEASHFLSSQIALSLQLDRRENTNTTFIKFLKQGQNGRLCSENWCFQSFHICPLEALLCLSCFIFSSRVH